MAPKFEEDFCPHFHHAIELIGRRWTGVVLRSMLQGATRFGDIAATVPNLSDKMLVERLKELEAEGMITRTVVPEMPVRIEYQLTEKGRDLQGVLHSLDAWADRWVSCPESGSSKVGGIARDSDQPAESQSRVRKAGGQKRKVNSR